MNKVEQFITDTWQDTVITQKEDEGTLLGLPYPFTCPTVNSTFREMYYWDTYFLNKGLILCGKSYQAKNNVDNMLYLVNKYGYMPNGNRTFYLSNTQEPFLSQMVMDIYAVYNDPVWLKSAYGILLKEYDFWMSPERLMQNGLNRYYFKILNDSEKEKFYRLAQDRVGDLKAIFKDRAEDKEFVALCIGTDAESGWDCSPRMPGRQIDCNWVDCNSNLYIYEKNFAEICRILNIDGADDWDKKAETRAELMRKYMWDGKCFIDYDFVRDEHIKVFSSACFYPMVAGLCTEAEAKSIVSLLPRIECDYGISACEKCDAPGNYQWGYPNGWPCQQYQVVMGLDRYGYKADAKRIAEKYVNTVNTVFEQTGHLWEKYNVTDGSINVINEYEMPAMMGWSAGVYMALCDYLKNN